MKKEVIEDFSNIGFSAISEESLNSEVNGRKVNKPDFPNRPEPQNPNNYSLRFNPPKDWFGPWNLNIHLFGLVQLLQDVYNKFYFDETTQRGAGRNPKLHVPRKPRKMLEIGSYKGESTLLFAASGLFDEIHCIDPHEGYEEANELFNEDWNSVQSDFFTNTRLFKDKIVYHRDYSYNIANQFADGHFDFIYIDASHKYEDVYRDIFQYRFKTNMILAGHDYGEHNGHEGVAKAVHELVGTPYMTYMDGSWMTFRKNGK